MCCLLLGQRARTELFRGIWDSLFSVTREFGLLVLENKRLGISCYRGQEIWDRLFCGKRDFGCLVSGQESSYRNSGSIVSLDRVVRYSTAVISIWMVERQP